MVLSYVSASLLHKDTSHIGFRAHCNLIGSYVTVITSAKLISKLCHSHRHQLVRLEYVFFLCMGDTVQSMPVIFKNSFGHSNNIYCILFNSLVTSPGTILIPIRSKSLLSLSNQLNHSNYTG